MTKEVIITSSGVGRSCITTNKEIMTSSSVASSCILTNEGIITSSGVVKSCTSTEEVIITSSGVAKSCRSTNEVIMTSSDVVKSCLITYKNIIRPRCRSISCTTSKEVPCCCIAKKSTVIINNCISRYLNGHLYYLHIFRESFTCTIIVSPLGILLCIFSNLKVFYFFLEFFDCFYQNSN